MSHNSNIINLKNAMGMKKIYTLTLALAVAITASASQRHTAVVSTIPAEEKALPTALTPLVNKLKAAGITAPAKVPAKAMTADLSHYNGYYTWTYKSLLESLPDASLTINVTDETTGEAVIEGLPQNFKLNATFDKEAGTLTIANKQYLGTDGSGDVCYFYLKPTNSSGSVQAGASDAAASVGTVDGNKISFPFMDVWAIGDYNDEVLGWWSMTYSNTLTLQDADDDDPNDSGDGDENSWTNVGTATLVDGWLTPAFGDDQFESPYEVDLERNDSNPNKYRVVNPYKGSYPLAFLNSADRDGYIQFDLSDPDHVTFDIVEAGLTIANMSSFGEFYCYNTLAALCDYFGLAPSQIIAILGDECPYTTYKDNVVELNYIVMTGEDGSQETVYDACFGTNDNPYAGSYWDGDTNMCAQIILPENLTNGVDAVLPAADNDAVRYFNLQGVELAKPAAGSVVIRLQNGKAVKTIMK